MINSGMQTFARLIAVLVMVVPSAASLADDSQVSRGEYLVRFGGCNDCHTPGYFLGKPDTSRFLAGSDVGFDLPGMGTFVGPNLTPDKETGLGNWSRDQIITAKCAGRIATPMAHENAQCDIALKAKSVFMKDRAAVVNG